ncbi:cytochrome P450 4V2-like [Temnothorax curvispinosus]|uniref:Cytochrome P450 4V2-like n=1 Tax=Temnothorax curvispinosus TaxID=300111 RepID=A0A6J1Q851_9HYME|nr:cytochrome P450 4V2-like [Temnothorax curvispinosus]
MSVNLHNKHIYIHFLEEQWKFLITLTDEFYPIGKAWGFFFPVISIRHSNGLETILSSTKHIKKSLLYDVLQPWFGTGLLTSGESSILAITQPRLTGRTNKVKQPALSHKGKIHAINIAVANK